MIPGFEKIVEDRIKKAQKDGEFNNLPGAGKPISFDSESNVPDDLKLVFKILKNAGFVPTEIQLKKEIEKTEDLLDQTSDTAQKYKILKKLNYLIMKLNSMRSSSAECDIPEKYMPDLVKRME